jgi:hypothetical protein
MGFMERLGKVVRAEISAITHAGERRSSSVTGGPQPATTPPGAATTPPARTPLVTDVDGALRVLELTGEPTLDLVRQRAHELARHYHPKTTSTDAEEARAARLVVQAITEALEILEEHLLPVAPVPPSTPPTLVIDP